MMPTESAGLGQGKIVIGSGATCDCDVGRLLVQLAETSHACQGIGKLPRIRLRFLPRIGSNTLCQ